MIPWMNFKNVYLYRDTSRLPIKELICPTTESPENEQIKLIIESFNIKGRDDELISLQPLVNSMLPKNEP